MLCVNPKLQYLVHRDETRKVLDGNRYILDDKVTAAFELGFAEYIKAKKCISIANSTDAIHQQEGFKPFYMVNSFSITEKLLYHILPLPIQPELTKFDVQFICSKLWQIRVI